MTAQALADAYKAADNSMEDVEGLTVIDGGEWEQNHKTQYRTSIVQFGGSLYSIMAVRSGSYHTDWYDEGATIYPVDRHEEPKIAISYPATGTGVDVEGRW